MGRKKEISDATLFDGLVRVFCDYGYEGANMSRIAEATGLGKASLYHRFPGGKEEMAQAALARADEMFAGYVLAPLAISGDPKARLRQVSKRLTEFYEDGRKSCLLDTLSLGTDPALQPIIQNSFEALKGALIHVAQDAGLSKADARRRAEQAIIELHGSLVWARGSGDRKPFQRVVKELPDAMTA